MNRVIFSSWAGKVVDNRGLKPEEFAEVDNLEFPLSFVDGRRVTAFVSWNGLVVADSQVSVVDTVAAYMRQVIRLACGECSLGYNGVRIIANLLARILDGQGNRKDIDLIEYVATGIRENAKCDFCALAVRPVLDSLKYYQKDYLELITGQKPTSSLVYITRVTAPCMEACPAHQDVPGYIELVRNCRYDEALSVIRGTNCLPGATGRACVAFCEEDCVRNDIDSPLAIRALKRVPADHEVICGSKPVFERVGESKKKVAVVGAGPAGLAAGYNLALKGYQVTVFDEQREAGGMLLSGIPPYRLPKDVLGREVDIIKKLGVDIKLNTRMGDDITPEELKKQGFGAVFVATGAHLSRDSGIKNWDEQHEGLVDGLKFLKSINLGEKVKPKGRVLIVGGGNTAVDCARTCLRLGSRDVTIVYRRSRVEMPARAEEVAAAEQEGAKIHFLAVPVKILTKDGRVTGAECIRMELGEPDASGRRRPVPVKGSEFVLPADMIIPAIGEVPDVSFLAGQIELTDWGAAKVKTGGHQTSQPWLFAGGDCVTGPATIVEAIAAGNRAASSIDQYLKRGEVNPSEAELVENLLHPVALSRQRDGVTVDKKRRQSPEELSVGDRVDNFDEVEKCFTADAATREAGRCLRCYRVMLLAVGKD